MVISAMGNHKLTIVTCHKEPRAIPEAMQEIFSEDYVDDKNVLTVQVRNTVRRPLVHVCNALQGMGRHTDPKRGLPHVLTGHCRCQDSLGPSAACLCDELRQLQDPLHTSVLYRAQLS